MILTLLNAPKLNRLSIPSLTAHQKLYHGEQFLIQTVDKKLALTTHRVIQRRLPWTLHGSKYLMLEDITGWEIKTAGKPLYLGMSVFCALLVYFNNAFASLSGFFLMLYLMTRQRRIHIKATNTVMVVPLEVEEDRISSLIGMVRTAQQERVSYLKKMKKRSASVCN